MVKHIGCLWGGWLKSKALFRDQLRELLENAGVTKTEEIAVYAVHKQSLTDALVELFLQGKLAMVYNPQSEELEFKAK